MSTPTTTRTRTTTTATRDRVRRWVVVAVLAGTAQLALAPAAFAGGKSCFFSWGSSPTAASPTPRPERAEPFRTIGHGLYVAGRPGPLPRRPPTGPPARVISPSGEGHDDDDRAEPDGTTALGPPGHPLPGGRRRRRGRRWPRPPRVVSQHPAGRGRPGRRPHRRERRDPCRLPFLPVLADTLQVSFATLALLVASRSLAGLAGPLVATAVTPRRTRALLLTGLLLTGAGALVVVAAAEVDGGVRVAVLLVGFAATGVARPLFDLPLQAWVAAHVPVARRGRAISVIELGRALSLAATSRWRACSSRGGAGRARSCSSSPSRWWAPRPCGGPSRARAPARRRRRPGCGDRPAGRRRAGGRAGSRPAPPSAARPR